MSSLNEELDTALMAAAGVLPSHFADSAELTLEPLSAIQATTLSLPGGAYGIECVVKDAGEVGTVILIVTGLVDHATGEILDRSEARTKWTEALSQALTALQEPLGAFKAGQIHMTDAFDALEKADECNVVGLFRGQTLAALLMTLPAKSTGQGAAAQLAAAIQAAEAEAEGEEPGDGEGELPDAAGAETAEAMAADTDLSAGAAAPVGAPGGPVPGGDPAQQGVYVPPPPRDPHGPADAPSMTLAPLTGAFTYSVDPRRIDLLRDVMMGVSVELGRTRMPVQQILGLIPGSIIELDRAAGAPVDVLVNGKLIAHGEVVVVDEEFAVRISEICSPEGEGRVSA
ncbi:flagellar motor switch protein FliN/FliY [Austwickia chelonae]|uniref:Flagellar motor switch protein FliN-like C-terminal domain-containing protein n=1 Tax=Austwickia chelonae NBRC 105200 TaxID=1184607 RepID=K6VM05_9MICO|nr:flagellar motor switch protein FliN [Austwickia chelonae]GAB77769.1 hypothetical protein AUCHE_08_00070 [Austwickia chelonae NBRC 105200]SEV89130.1 flagellar motor switch protein FliN/FliY [Austwickia chelonae]